LSLEEPGLSMDPLTPKKSIWLEEYDVTSFLVDFNKKLSLFGLLNMMQETAWRHAAHLGYGYQHTQSIGTSWVLVRQHIQMDAWPDWGDKLTVRTWLRPPSAALVTRDFLFFVEDRPFGRAAAHWITIDHKTRRPTPLPFPKNPDLFRQDGHLEINPARIQVSENLLPLTRFQVRHSDLDMNGHVNNTRFSQWILDSLPLEAHKFHVLKLYETNFLAEACHGDLVEIQGPTQQDDLTFQGRRVSDKTVLFTARIAGRESRSME
jgi:medium-chain acyl-[acyl-carrier-protein] hydrolase